MWSQKVLHLLYLRHAIVSYIHCDFLGYDDVPETIPDPDAKVPEDWDEEDDGEWEGTLTLSPFRPFNVYSPPLLLSPSTAPKIPNPAYKGPWSAKMIPNPAYQGNYIMCMTWYAY